MSDEELSLDEALRRTRSLEHELAEAHGALTAIARERNTWARQLADAKDEALNAQQEVEKMRAISAGVLNDRDELTVALQELLEEWGTRASENVGVSMRHHTELKRVVERWERSGIPEVDDE